MMKVVDAFDKNSERGKPDWSTYVQSPGGEELDACSACVGPIWG